MILDDLLKYNIDDYIVELIMSNYDLSKDPDIKIEPCTIITPTGYMSKEEFLMKVCNCEKVIDLKENNSNEAKIVFDETKVVKPFEEYLEEHNYQNLYVPEEERVYCTMESLNAHRQELEKNSENKENVVESVKPTSDSVNIQEITIKKSKKDKIKEKRARKVKKNR